MTLEVAWPLVTNKATGCLPDARFMWSSVVTRVTNFYTSFGCCNTMTQTWFLAVAKDWLSPWYLWVLKITMISTNSDSGALGHQHSTRCPPSPLESAWPSMEPRATDNPDPVCSMVTDIVMALSCTGLDVTMVPGSSKYPSNLYGTDCCITSGIQYHPRWVIRPWETTWPLAEAGVMEVDSGFSRTMDPDVALDSSLTWTSPWTLTAYPHSLHFFLPASFHST